jgi:polyferredoxin
MPAGSGRYYRDEDMKFKLPGKFVLPDARTLRRLSQIFFLVLFLVLFVKTDYSGKDEIPFAVNLFFRFNPLIGATAVMATRTLIALLWPALLTLLLTVVLGRFFCGWVCPMGTLLDGQHRLVRSKRRDKKGAPGLKYFLLVLILAGALFGLPLVGYFDPFSLLVRGLSMALYPAFGSAAENFFTFTYQKAPDWINLLTEPVYQLLKGTVLPFAPKVFTMVLPALAMLMAVFLLDIRQRRFFCRNLCPLGALLGLASRVSLLRGEAGKGQCGNCHRCRDLCRTGAISADNRIDSRECILCLDCSHECPQNRFGFRFRRPFSRSPGSLPLSAFGLSRRGLSLALVTGLALPQVLKIRALARVPEPTLIRPPGALPKRQFLDRCVRCGECMQVCINNALQPTFIEAGLEGMFSPKLVPRIGYCEYDCTLCGQVCPTGAIRILPLAEKRRTVIGRAIIDRNTCLPFAKGIPCIVCEEHCPTPRKAISFSISEVVDGKGVRKRIKQPYVIEDLCIGCGICENKCPLPGASAIRIASSPETQGGIYFSEKG